MYGFNKIYLQQIGNKMVFGWLFDSQYHFLTKHYIISASADSQPDTTPSDHGHFLHDPLSGQASPCLVRTKDPDKIIHKSAL